SAGQPPTASQKPGDGSDAGDAGGGADGTVAKDFLGTWKGEVRTDKNMSNGMLTVRISEGRVGDEAVRTVVTLPGNKQCKGAGTLTKVTDKKLTMRERGVGKPPEVLGVKLCTENVSTATLTRTGDGELRYASNDEGGGNPTADLTRDQP
ncbi:hypothetical protein KDA82_03120, partial [Streptomyces daliensis]|nr:hypothetical protein [Streptomyces daliensis]